MKVKNKWQANVEITRNTNQKNFVCIYYVPTKITKKLG